MKIMIINTLYHPYKIGGAEVSVQILAEKLAKIGHVVKVITLHNKPEKESTNFNGVDVTYLPLKNIYWPFEENSASMIKKILWHIIDQYNFSMKHAVKLEIKNFKPDVVHTNNLCGFSISTWDAANECNVKIVHTTRDYYLFHPNSTLFKNGRVMDEKELVVKFFSALKKWKSNTVTNFVGISHYISELHKKNGFSREATHNFIYNPVEPINYIKKESPYFRVGFIGRLTSDKGFDDFCAIASKYKNRTDIKFYAAGRFLSDENGKKMIVLANEANIELLGFVSQEEFMSNVDAVMLPTKWNEPFGRTVAECALSGKIVYTHFRGGISEIATLTSNVKPLDLLNIEGDAVYAGDKEENAIDSFDINRIVSQYEEVYKS